jgi:sulfoxide reductase heme-binding subunit YedZ
MTTLETSKSIWYLMRATGVVSLVLLTAVLALGIATVNRWRLGKTPAFVTAGVHRSISLLSVVFVAVHVVTAVVDPYAGVNVVGAVVPFVGSSNPLWIGFGAVSLDLVAALIVSSLLRRRIGVRAWRAVHWTAYLSWPVAFAHTLGTGSDVGTIWLRVVAALCFGVVTSAAVWRLAARRPGKRRPATADRARRHPTRAAAMKPSANLRLLTGASQVESAE